MSKFVATAGKIQKMHPCEVATDPEVNAHIAMVYDSVHGGGGEAFAERESRYIDSILRDDDKKWDVTPLSVFFAFVDLAVNNLTLAPGAQAMCYLLQRDQAYGGDGKAYYENRVYLSITGYGEILLRQRAGQIRHCDAPTVVYRGDGFGYREEDGRKIVRYELNLEHDTSCPVACFMKITRVDGSSDYAIMLPEAWGRLEKYSKKANNGKSNALYSSGNGQTIDPGFLIAKCVKHAFKSYPKMRIGQGMMMEADIPAPDEEEAEEFDPYAMAASRPADKPAMPKQDTGFAPEPDHSEGVTIAPAADVDDDDVF